MRPSDRVVLPMKTRSFVVLPKIRLGGSNPATQTMTDAEMIMTGPPQYDRFFAGFVIGKVVGLSLTFAHRVFGLLVGGTVAMMLYHGATSGLEALVAQVLSTFQFLMSRQILAIGIATGFVAALVIGPVLARQSQSEPEISS